MHEDALDSVAEALVAPGKGILAADESTPTITKRFETIGLESNEENRRAYREMLLTTAHLGDYISGVILFDETIRQHTSEGTAFPEVLRRQGILTGIKVDTGAKNLALCPGEKITEGLDGLRERFVEYAELGAQFSKWRAVIQISEASPTRACLLANAHALARFAALSQEAGLVPMVEPEVLMTGPHSLKRCERVTEATLKIVFQQLAEYRVVLEHMLLKPNMILSGEDAREQAGVEEVAEATLRCMRRNVPAAVPGIMFLSGGQSEVMATRHLNAINQLGNAPWQLSFSFGRALQSPALTTWAGKNVHGGQQALQLRAHCNSAARSGHYSDEMEREEIAA
jgi:fructose-bisphosphate aldolase, class I